MAAPTLENKHDIDAAQESKEQTIKLSDKQFEYIDKELDKAVKDGTLRREDRMKVYANMDKLTPSQMADAEKTLDKYINTKRKKREEYIKEMDDAVLNGLLSVDEHKQYLANYDKMPGDERQREFEEKWPKRLERKKMEKKEYAELLKESPHFFHEGKLTPEGETLLDEHNSKLKNEGEKLVLKRRLIKKLGTLDNFAALCKDRYQVANQHYQRGEYKTAAKLMKKNITTCERYPESARLKEFNDFAKGDHNNAVYEQLKNEKMNNKREEVQECFQGNDHEAALNCATEAVQMMEKIISTTYDGNQGEYHEGSSSEKTRSDKWKTPYMTNMLNKVKNEESQAKNIYKTFMKEEADEEERILNGEMDLIDQEQSADAHDQAIIKAALDTADDLSNQTKEEAEEETTTNTPVIEQSTVSIDEQSHFNTTDKEEDTELQDNFVDENAKEAELIENSLKPQASSNEELSQTEAEELSTEELRKQTVSINEEKDGKMEENKANELLRSEAKLKLTKDGRELNSKQQIQDELAAKLAKSRIEKINELQRSGNISSETADLHTQQAQEINSSQIGQDLIEQNQKDGKIINFQQQRSTQSKLGSIFKRNTDKKDIQKRMQENADKKREQMRKAA